MAGAPDSDAGRREERSLLPDHSILPLEAYLEMQRSIGNEHRFRILNALVEGGDMSATELREALDLRGNTLHYHLEELVDVGLVENRKRKTTDSRGLYSYYRASAMGEAILEHGIRELLRREWESLEEYGG
ncbi:winged helix-turn-helix domain-containing protein [Natrononativus amylolyticus]|uniref:winged helix-turn-helix domain-containing protein n=1 Tax=Natrononativus amylolyticus TaxID=2963434 RepID=UPI0020CCAE44|nr:helix-turn-helix domain-containing protein [Natrononativus amylolyticus]